MSKGGKQLRELIKDSQFISMYQQGRAINKAFKDWKGNLEQVDDVCIIGVKLI